MAEATFHSSYFQCARPLARQPRLFDRRRIRSTKSLLTSPPYRGGPSLALYATWLGMLAGTRIQVMPETTADSSTAIWGNYNETPVNGYMPP